jgi:hypothetical protein
MNTPNWPAAVIGRLRDEFHNFGAAGLYDTNNPGLMSLGITHRSHVERLGYFWAPRFKNWYALFLPCSLSLSFARTCVLCVVVVCVTDPLQYIHYHHRFSDNFIQELYTDRLSFGTDHQIHNTQRYGQRYNACMHSRLYIEEIAKAHSAFIVQFARELKALPQDDSSATSEQIQRRTELRQWIARSTRLRNDAVAMLAARGQHREIAPNQHYSSECPTDHIANWENLDQLEAPYFGKT